MSQMHGSDVIRCRGLLKEGIDRVLMQTGVEKVLEFRKGLVNVRDQLNFQPGTLLDDFLSEPSERFEFDIIQIL